jgi:outer membrane protein, multidrug efflux system
MCRNSGYWFCGEDMPGRNSRPEPKDRRMRQRPSSVVPGKPPRLRRLASALGVLVLASALSGALSGCLLGPDKVELGLDIPESYRAAQGKPDAAVPSLDWWRSFRSRELTLLMEETQSANFDIAAAAARVLQADANARIVNAALLPNITLNDSATRTKAAVSGTNVGGSQVRSIYNLSFNASYVIDFWGKNRAALAAAEQTAIASRFDREVITLTALASVSNAYFQMLAAQDRLRIARNNAQAAARILTLIKDRASAGTASDLEVSQQQSLLATQRASIPPLEITLRQSVSQLAVLVGRVPEHFALGGGSLNRITVPRVTPGLPAELLNQRPDIREAEAKLASANYSVQSARAAFFPNIQLTGTTGWQSAALASLFGPGAWFYTMAASLTQPIFDGGVLFGQLDVQQALREEALQLYRKSVHSAFSDVEQALVALQQQSIRERLQIEVVRSSRTAFDISEQRLRGGTLDLVTLIQTQQTLFAAEDLLAQIRLARLLAAVSLYQALGGGWPPADGPPA